MKKLLLSLLIVIASVGVSLAQVPPRGISYQAVVTDDLGRIQDRRQVTFRINILQGSASGSAVYAETHKVTTNDKGIVNFTIGRGTKLVGEFDEIVWQEGHFFAKIELDLDAGTNFRFMGTTELLSVPYAFFAYKADTTNFAHTAGPVYKKGDLAEGGMVIATWDGGRHGWVVALEDESTFADWFSAKLACEGKTTGGYRDWVLPTITQLNLIYQEKGLYDEKELYGDFQRPLYWSSSESGPREGYGEEFDFVWILLFNSYSDTHVTGTAGEQTPIFKLGYKAGVRAVRAF